MPSRLPTWAIPSAPSSSLRCMATASTASSSPSSTLSIPPRPLRPLAGPHKLPRLLSILPNAGKLSLVRPVNGHPSQFYLVTRSKLKFTNVTEQAVDEGTESKVQGAKVGGIQQERRGKKVALNPVDGGTVMAHGKAWGMLFKNGRYVSPQIASRMPDPIIRKGLKTAWVALDPSTLPAQTRDAIDSWKASHAEHLDARRRLFEERKNEAAVRKGERREEIRRIEEFLAERKKDMMKVNILY